MPTNDWDSAYALAVETMERLNRQPFKLIAIEIDGKQVWPPEAPPDPHALGQRLAKIEAALDTLLAREVAKDWYTTEEVAKRVDKAEFTVREWCRLGRIRAEKRRSGRGAFPAWVISHAELQRYQREGLLPLERRA
jgi:hypothetical protein